MQLLIQQTKFTIIVCNALAKAANMVYNSSVKSKSNGGCVS